MSWRDFFTGGAFNAVEKVALELIETDKESAEAKVIAVKALDPNGKMRRDQSSRVGKLYTIYFTLNAVLIVVKMIYTMFIGGDLLPDDHVLVALTEASNAMKDLFVPITTLYGAIVTASFGVSYANVKQGK